jgi:hypothetical protein
MKNPLVTFGLHVRVSASASGDGLANVVRWWLRLPPSGLNPQHSASASSSVDLPLPFSPTKNVTLLRRVRSIPEENTRTLKGYVDAAIFSGRLSMR